MKGILIIGHGSRSKEAQEQFMEVVAKVRKSLDRVVEGAFMELAEPGFEEAVEKLIKAEIKEIAVYPLFLFSGIHIMQDIPEMIEEAAKKHSNISFSMAQPIGARDELVQIVLKGIEEL